MKLGSTFGYLGVMFNIFISRHYDSTSCLQYLVQGMMPLERILEPDGIPTYEYRRGVSPGGRILRFIFI